MEYPVKNKIVVPGDGSKKPKVIFVGEAPGANEEIQRIPFVGKAGQILRKALKEIGFSEEDYYITNLVKIRPPNNRDPTPEEAKLWFPYLKWEFAKLNPKVICSLGAHSTKYLISHGDFDNVSKDSISKLRGKITIIDLDGDDYKLFPTYHPAATIYRQQLKDTFLSDLKKLKEYVYAKNDLSQWV